MSVPLILTILAAGIMLLILLMEMLPAALAAEGMSPVLGYGMFIFGLLGYFGLDRMLPHAHPPASGFSQAHRTSCG